MRWFYFFPILFVLPIISHADTIYVPDDYPSIQSAVVAALGGDTIIVRAGTYYENIDYLAKGITIESESGAKSTVIDGQQNGSVAIMRNTSGTQVLKGFTITNGFAEDGGGIYSDFGYPHILKCEITNNLTEDGDIWDDGGDGAGIYCRSAWIKNCVIENNATGTGGYDNTRGGHGGGIYLISGSSIIENCVIRSNTTGMGGGGFDAGDGGSEEPMSMGFGGDGGDGGGVYGQGVNLVNCVILNNKTGEGGSGQFGPGVGGRGAGVYSKGNLQTVNNCTIVHNRTGFHAVGGQAEGGGIFSLSPVEAINSIFWGNAPNQINNVSVTMSYCDIQDGASTGWFDPETCIDEDPEFAGIPGDDYRLSMTSPCINRGTASASPPEDIDGQTRPDMGQVDMGADEYHGNYALEADTFFISAAAGGEVYFFLDARAGHAHQPYILLGSLSGSMPGTKLPGGTTLRLEWDDFTTMVYQSLNNSMFQHFLGVLDGNGLAVATLWTPPLPPSWIDAEAEFAFTVYNPFDFVSNPVKVKIVR